MKRFRILTIKNIQNYLSECILICFIDSVKQLLISSQDIIIVILLSLAIITISSVVSSQPSVQRRTTDAIRSGKARECQCHLLGP